MKNNNYILKALVLAGLVVANNVVRATEATDTAAVKQLSLDKQTVTFEVFQPTENQIEQLPIVIPGATEKDAIVVYHNNQYSVIQNGTVHKVQEDCVANELRNVAPAQLLNFMENGLINVSQKEDGQFTLNPALRDFGGPISANITYWCVKAICYGVGAAAITTSVAVTGGGVAGASAGVIATAATLPASAGASLVSGAIVGAGLGGHATVLTATTMSLIPSTMTFIESLATATSMLVFMSPLP